MSHDTIPTPPLLLFLCLMPPFCLCVSYYMIPVFVSVSHAIIPVSAIILVSVSRVVITVSLSRGVIPVSVSMA